VANAGTLNYNNAANVSVNAAVTNTGTINVLSGNLTLSSFSANGGILNLANGATLSNGGTLNNSGTLQGGRHAEPRQQYSDQHWDHQPGWYRHGRHLVRDRQSDPGGCRG
jgi:hypothetical protein